MTARLRPPSGSVPEHGSVPKGSAASASDLEFSWPCEHCGFIARGSTSCSVTCLKYKHLARHHKNLPTRTRRREAPWTETVVGDLPPGGWQCGLCFQGLPRLSTNERTRSIGRHLAAAHPGRSRREANQAWLHAKGALAQGNRTAVGCAMSAVHCSKAEVYLRRLRHQGHDPVFVGVDPGTKGRSFWTCRNLSGLRRTAEAGQACLGEGLRQTLCRRKSRLRMWKFCSAARRKALCQAWGLDCKARRKLSVAAAKVCKTANRGPGKWERDLSQENIEPRPGPEGSSNCCGRLRLAALAFLHCTHLGSSGLGSWLPGHVGPLLWFRELVREGVEPNPGPPGLQLLISSTKVVLQPA